MVSIADASIQPITVGGGIITGHVGVNRSLEFMAKNFSRPVQLMDLVKASKLSRRGFCKAFLKSVGSTPGAFLRSLRIEHAKRLLSEHDLPLKKIAPQCGFRSENTFCVAFARATRMSPKQYQRAHWLSALRIRRGVGEASQAGRMSLLLSPIEETGRTGLEPGCGRIISA